MVYRIRKKTWCLPEPGALNAVPHKFKKETDILDVWFDSGVSYAAVMEAREYLDSPSDLIP